MNEQQRTALETFPQLDSGDQLFCDAASVLRSPGISDPIALVAVRRAHQRFQLGKRIFQVRCNASLRISRPELLGSEKWKIMFIVLVGFCGCAEVTVNYEHAPNLERNVERTSARVRTSQ